MHVMLIARIVNLVVQLQLNKIHNFILLKSTKKRLTGKGGRKKQLVLGTFLQTSTYTSPLPSSFANNRCFGLFFAHKDVFPLFVLQNARGSI